jgi:hypothetical protein
MKTRPIDYSITKTHEETSSIVSRQQRSLRGVAPAEANGDSRSTMEFIGLVVPVQENFCPALADLVSPIQDIFLYLTSFFPIFFLLLFEMKFTEYFTDKSHKEVTKQ